MKKWFLAWRQDQRSALTTVHDTARNVSSNERVSGDVISQGIFLYGEVGGTSKTSGTIVLEDNTFNTTEPTGYESYAMLLDGTDQGILGQLVTDVNLVSTASGHATYDLFAADESVVGAGYDMDGGLDGTVVFGKTGTSEYAVVTSGTTNSDIIFSNTVL